MLNCPRWLSKCMFVWVNVCFFFVSVLQWLGIFPVLMLRATIIVFICSRGISHLLFAWFSDFYHWILAVLPFRLQRLERSTLEQFKYIIFGFKSRFKTATIWWTLFIFYLTRTVHKCEQVCVCACKWAVKLNSEQACSMCSVCAKRQWALCEVFMSWPWDFSLSYSARSNFMSEITYSVYIH